jgi:hypothetical protein
MKEKEKIESKRRRQSFGFVAKNINFAFGFVGKKSTSLDNEVDEEQEITKSKRASSLKKIRLNVKKKTKSGRNDYFTLA